MSPLHVAGIRKERIMIFEMLMKKDTSELIAISSRYGIPFPVETDEQMEAEIKECYSDGSKYLIDYYLKTTDEEMEIDLSEYEELNDDDIERYKKYNDREKHKAELVKAIEKSRPEICNEICKMILNPDEFKKIYVELSDESINHMLNAESIDEEDGIVRLKTDLKSHDRYDAEILKRWGICELVKLDAYDSPDEYEHITEIIFTEDVLEVFKGVHSDELDRKRRKYNMIFDCCYVAQRYHDVSPIENAYKMYMDAARDDTKLPYINLDEFTAEAKMLEKRDEMFFVYETEDAAYITNESYIDDDEESLVDILIEDAQDADTSYYIPSPEEREEFAKNSWWPSRESFNKLKIFIEKFYLDEQYIHNTGNSMFRMISDDEEYLKERFYSMDDVERNMEEQLSFMTMDIMFGRTLEEIEDYYNFIFLAITEKAKEEFIEIFENCVKDANLVSLNGHRMNEGSLML